MALVTPTITGSSQFWGNLLSPTLPQGTMLTMDQSKSRAKGAWRIAKIMKQQGMRDARGAFAALIGAAAGGAALNQYKRVAAVATPTSVTAYSGARSIETVSAIDRVTTAADVTELKKWFANALLEAGITYPTVTGPNIAGGMMQTGGTGRFG